MTARSFVIHNPTILENGLLVPREFQGDQQAIVETIEPEDESKPVILEALIGQDRLVPSVAPIRAIISEVSISRDRISASRLDGSGGYVTGLGQVEAKIVVLDSDSQNLLPLINGHGGVVNLYIVPDESSFRPRPARYSGSTISLSDVYSTNRNIRYSSAWGGTAMFIAPYDPLDSGAR